MTLTNEVADKKVPAGNKKERKKRERTRVDKKSGTLSIRINKKNVRGGGARTRAAATCRTRTMRGEVGTIVHWSLKLLFHARYARLLRRFLCHRAPCSCSSGIPSWRFHFRLPRDRESKTDQSGIYPLARETRSSVSLLKGLLALGPRTLRRVSELVSIGGGG